MSPVRHLIAQRHFAMLICVVALLMKLVVPTGYMIASDHGRIAITLCPDAAPRTMTMAMPGMHGGMTDHASDHGDSKDHGKAAMPCAFGGLSAAAMGAIDPVQLAALIVFVMAVVLAGVVLPVPVRRAYLRPPLRGPPVYR